MVVLKKAESHCFRVGLHITLPVTTVWYVCSGLADTGWSESAAKRWSQGTAYHRVCAGLLDVSVSPYM